MSRRKPQIPFGTIQRPPTSWTWWYRPAESLPFQSRQRHPSSCRCCPEAPTPCWNKQRNEMVRTQRRGPRFPCVEVDISSEGCVNAHGLDRRKRQHCYLGNWSVEYSHIRCAGHVLLHLCQLLDVLDRSMKSTINSLEAPDGGLLKPQQTTFGTKLTKTKC